MKYVAFLRAINVGSHIVKMDQLRGVFEAMAFTNVQTFIASGNVIFDSKTKSPAILEKKIEKQLEERFGYEVKTFLRTVNEIAGVVSYVNPKEIEKPGNILYIGFMTAAPDHAASNNLAALADDINDFRVHNREIYWLRRTSLGESKYSMGLVEKTLKMPVTFRNATTVRKILAKYS